MWTRKLLSAQARAACFSRSRRVKGVRACSDISHNCSLPEKPLGEVYNEFLLQIKDHGGGSVSLKKTVHENVVDIHIENPSKRNCLSGKMIYQLISVIDTLSAREEYSHSVAVILRGHGSDDGVCKLDSASPAFCAGLDFSLAKEVINSPSQGLIMCNMMTEALNRFRNMNMISVALIHGPALGGGAELSTACDFRLITDDPSSTMGFVHGKLAASPGWGGGKRLLDIVGRNQALRLFGSACILTPNEANDVRLADAVLSSSSDKSLLQQSLSFLEPFTSMPYPAAVKDLKYLVGGLSSGSSAECGRLEKDIFKKRWGSDDNVTALRKK